MLKYWLAENEQDGPWTVYSLGRTTAAEGESKVSHKELENRFCG